MITDRTKLLTGGLFGKLLYVREMLDVSKKDIADIDKHLLEASDSINKVIKIFSKENNIDSGWWPK